MDEIIKRVLDFIETTGSVLVKAGFELTVRQIVMENLIWMTTILLCLLLSVVFFRWAGKRQKKYYWGKKLMGNYGYHAKENRFTEEESKAITFYGENSEGVIDTYYIMGWICLGVCLVIAFIFIPQNIIALSNPQYAAISRIIYLIK